MGSLSEVVQLGWDFRVHLNHDIIACAATDVLMIILAERAIIIQDVPTTKYIYIYIYIYRLHISSTTLTHTHTHTHTHARAHE